MCIFLSGPRRQSAAWLRCVRLLFLLLPLGAAWATAAETTLTLETALKRTLENNPELQVFQWRLQAIDGLRQSSDLAPALELGFEAENILGGDEYSSFDNAELTVSLSSVFELGGKRSSRLAAADSRYALAEAERQARALDLLGQVTQSFIAALTLQEKLKVAEEATQLAAATQKLVSFRVERGAAPEAERLRASAALTQSRLSQAALDTELQNLKMALSVLWGAEHVTFDQLAGNLFQFEATANFDELYQRVLESPAIEVFSREERVRDADVALARSQSSANVRWSVGVRRFEDGDNSALTAGFSMPLFSGQRNSGALKSALAEKEMVSYRKQESLLVLRSRLFQAWQMHRQNVATAKQMNDEVLPLLAEAMQQTRQAYEAGRYRYLDWVTAQHELLSARLTTIDAASMALLNQALIEQLTAQSLSDNPSNKLNPNAPR